MRISTTNESSVLCLRAAGERQSPDNSEERNGEIKCKGCDWECYLHDISVRKVLGDVLHHILAYWCCAGAQEPQRAEVGLGHLPLLGERDHHRRHAVEVRHSVPLDRLQDRIHVEPRHRDDAVAPPQLGAAPRHNWEQVITDKPNMWNMGRKQRAVLGPSPLESWSDVAMWAVQMKFRWVRTTPLLAPVVPEEYSSAATSDWYTGGGENPAGTGLATRSEK
ncbi:hypothetical protein B296_00053880 [Ensete ventricosum]|uniref:Uncharacterized protein n=1 Tax=Ensete ventricosum TaxID=4639 RepID=A0A426Y210_ENSVE|nr:hypothetical protein B296_00053880 [Ensete ventricosum]